MSQASFLHLADLHLDSPFNSVSYLPDRLKMHLKDASFLAFREAIDFAIASECDAVLVSGDIYDGVKTSARAQVFFKECLQALSSAGIYSIVAHGNHDLSTDWALVTEWPDKVMFLPHLGFDSVKIISKTGEELSIIGSSGVYDSIQSLREGVDSVLESNTINRNKFIVSVFHADVSGKSSIARSYTSLLPSEFTSLPVNYWALGHIHQFAVVNENPHIVYSGTIQGRSLKPSECGEKGGVHVVVENSQLKEINFRKFSSAHFNHMFLKVEKVISQGDLISELKHQLSDSIRSQDIQILRLTVKTIPENRRGFNIVSREEEFLTTLREVVFRDLGIAIESVRWEIIKQQDSPLAKEIIFQVENIIETELLSTDSRIADILKSESVLRGVDTELNLTEVVTCARERITSLLQGGDER